MKLIIKWEDFKSEVEILNIEAKNILSKESLIEKDTEFEEIKAENKNWVDKCYNFLQNSFDVDNNDFAIGFRNARVDRYNFGNNNKNFKQVVKEYFEDIKSKNDTLNYFIKIIQISDSIIKPEIVEIQNRSNFSTNDILELILDKLFLLYDDYYHSIPAILLGNSITLKRHGEDRELIKILEDRGLVTTNNTREINAQLTLEGKLFIEEKRTVYKENYNKIDKNPQEMNTKIDEVLEKLNKLGFGQEVVFNEIEELKELYITLNKKNWGQVVKGKIFDIGLEKLIDYETLKYVFEALTDNKLRLP